MRFDVTMLLFLVSGIIFLVGCTLGSSLYHEDPNMNITRYADENVKNLSMNNSSYEKTSSIGNQTGRMRVIMRNLTYFFRDVLYQVNAMGIEYGFDNGWVPPVAFASGALVLTIICVFGDQLSFLLIPIALAIIAKDWIGERILKRGDVHSQKHNQGPPI